MHPFSGSRGSSSSGEVATRDEVERRRERRARLARILMGMMIFYVQKWPSAGTRKTTKPFYRREYHLHTVKGIQPLSSSNLHEIRSSLHSPSTQAWISGCHCYTPPKSCNHGVDAGHTDGGVEYHGRDSTDLYCSIWGLKRARFIKSNVCMTRILFRATKRLQSAGRDAKRSMASNWPGTKTTDVPTSRIQCF